MNSLLRLDRRLARRSSKAAAQKRRGALDNCLGNVALRRVLTEAAQAAARTKKKDQTYLRGQYGRLVARCGNKKAIVVVGHTILRIAHHLLSTHTPYQERELTRLDQRRQARRQQQALDQLRALGYEVTLTPKEPAA